MAGRRDSFDLPVGGFTRNRSDGVHATSSNVSSSNSNSSGSNSADSIDRLNFDRLSLENKFIKFERDFRRLIKLAREVLNRDHTFDSLSARTLNTQQYYSLLDRAADWVTKPASAALFTDHATYSYLAQMAAIMQTLEIALAIPHQPVKWPGATSGPNPIWPGVNKHEVFCQFDQLVKGDREVDTEAMPWNRRDDIAVSN
ncbi:hypothetical protein N0V87_001400 [Didymella glomerata]|jgi:hypothetical protein|uniref:Uncharacterized protein n=1 Tax=Didymella glomerata TaxID=749621 RepID=A0A9W8X795_9PLEO|nr:hypothetical protein N0V87_001400 [Didymella glomerata]